MVPVHGRCVLHFETVFRNRFYRFYETVYFSLSMITRFYFAGWVSLSIKCFLSVLYLYLIKPLKNMSWYVNVINYYSLQ